MLYLLNKIYNKWSFLHDLGTRIKENWIANWCCLLMWFLFYFIRIIKTVLDPCYFFIFPSLKRSAKWNNTQSVYEVRWLHMSKDSNKAKSKSLNLSKHTYKICIVKSFLRANLAGWGKIFKKNLNKFYLLKDSSEIKILGKSWKRNDS